MAAMSGTTCCFGISWLSVAMFTAIDGPVDPHVRCIIDVLAMLICVGAHRNVVRSGRRVPICGR